MPEHARLAPSASDRWIPCAASIPMSEGVEDTESPQAAEGTLAHHILLDEALTDWLLMGTTTVECDDEEMKAYLQQCFDYVVNRYNEMPGNNKRILIETRVDLHYMTNRDDMWGQADVIIFTDTYIDCIDLKYGAGTFVEADASQNKIYLLGAMSEVMKATREDAEWISVRSTIMQPRLPDIDGEIFRWEEYDPEELITWKDEVLIPAAARTDIETDPVPGTKQCQFCPVKATCPAVAQAVTDLCNVFEPVLDFDGNPDPSGAMVKLDELANTDLMDVARLMEVHNNIPFIEGYLKAVSERLRILIEQHHPDVRGRLKIVRSRGRNKWNLDDDTLLIEELTKGTGRLKKGQITKQAVISAPQALKISGLKPAQLKKMQEYIVKGEGSLTIVPFSDPRPDAFPPMPFESIESVSEDTLLIDGEVDAWLDPEPEPEYDWI